MQGEGDRVSGGGVVALNKCKNLKILKICNQTLHYVQGDNSNVILSEAKNLNYALQITNSEFYISVQNNPSRLQ